MNSEVIKFVAGGGKTTLSEKILKEQGNGLYLAFTNSVVEEISNKGYLSRTIDSLFTSFIIPKFTSFIPIIASGSKVKHIDTTILPNHLKGISNIKIDKDGNIYNKSKKLNININTYNENLHNMTSKDNIGFLKYIFSKDELRLTHELRSNLSDYLINNYSIQIIELLSKRFTFIIIDEAQDLKNYREKFAEALYNSKIKLIVLGDDNQNITGGGDWFEKLSPTDTKQESFRCPENNCKWIRENLNIDIYGNSNISEFKTITFDEVTNYDDGNKTLLYSASSGKNKNIVDNWKGPKDTIKSAKGSTIYNDVVIIGSTINRKNYYTAITITTGNVYSTITKWN